MTTSSPAVTMRSEAQVSSGIAAAIVASPNPSA